MSIILAILALLCIFSFIVNLIFDAFKGNLESIIGLIFGIVSIYVMCNL